VRFDDARRADPDQRWTVEDWGPASGIADTSDGSRTDGES